MTIAAGAVLDLGPGRGPARPRAPAGAAPRSGPGRGGRGRERTAYEIEKVAVLGYVQQHRGQGRERRRPSTWTGPWPRRERTGSPGAGSFLKDAQRSGVEDQHKALLDTWQSSRILPEGPLETVCDATGFDAVIAYEILKWDETKLDVSQEGSSTSTVQLELKMYAKDGTLLWSGSSQMVGYSQPYNPSLATSSTQSGIAVTDESLVPDPPPIEPIAQQVASDIVRHHARPAAQVRVHGERGQRRVVMPVRRPSRTCASCRPPSTRPSSPAREGEVPVGAVVVSGSRIIGRGHNRTEALQDPTAHAEMLAVTAAANTLGSWRLENTTLYVTLEPCLMCAGAVFLSRVARLVYAAPDPKRGALGSVVDVSGNEALNHHTEVEQGPMAMESGGLLSAFFEELRKKAGAD